MPPKLVSGFLFLSLVSAAAPKGCVGSVGVASFRLSARPAGNNAPAAIPIHQVNNLGAGYRISYAPLDLPANLGKDAKLTLVVVPKSNDGQMTVLEPRLAASSSEWSMPFSPSIVLLVFAPQGLDEKRLTNLVTKDDNMVAALADYADQTADLEAGLQLAKELQDQADEDTLRPPRPATPADQAIFALVRALNPSVSSYDPLGAGRRAGPATLTGKGIEGFFENAGGLFPGAGALPMIKQWLMPDTEFRSVYAVPVESDGMTLCAQLGPRSRNKQAYMWAYRLTNAPAPAASVFRNGDVPIGMRVGVPIKLETMAQWRLMDHVFDWKLLPAGFSQPPMHVSVRAVPEERALRVDLRKFAGAPGAYSLQGTWDWDAYKISGEIRLHRFDDLKSAAIAPESQDKLITASGPVDVDLTGCDFLFIDRAALHRPQSAAQTVLDLPEERTGPNLRLEIDTDGLRPGPYLLALSRIDGATADVSLRVLPAPPKLDPVRANLGERQQPVTLTGTALDRISAIESDAADFTLGPTSAGGAKRSATIRLHSGLKPGDRGALSAKVDGMNGPLRFPIALQIAGPRPRIVDAKASLPKDLSIAPRDGEIPAGSWASFAMKIEPPDAQPAMTLECAESSLTIQPLKLHAGEKQPGAQLVSDSGGAMFLSLDPGAVGQSGCTLTAAIETEALGKSDLFKLGKVVRLPRIENFSMSDEKAPAGFYGLLRGFDLETIGKTGWDAQSGLDVSEVPRPIAGEGAKQSLRIAVPWPSPSPKAPLFIWLRGESEARASKVTQ